MQRTKRAILGVMAEAEWPSVPYISEGVGRAKSVTHGHLWHLRLAGLVNWVDDKKGTLRLTPEGILAAQGYESIYWLPRSKGKHLPAWMMSSWPTRCAEARRVLKEE